MPLFRIHIRYFILLLNKLFLFLFILGANHIRYRIVPLSSRDPLISNYELILAFITHNYYVLKTSSALLTRASMAIGFTRYKSLAEPAIKSSFEPCPVIKMNFMSGYFPSSIPFS